MGSFGFLRNIISSYLKPRTQSSSHVHCVYQRRIWGLKLAKYALSQPSARSLWCQHSAEYGEVDDSFKRGEMPVAGREARRLDPQMFIKIIIRDSKSKPWHTMKQAKRLIAIMLESPNFPSVNSPNKRIKLGYLLREPYCSSRPTKSRRYHHRYRLPNRISDHSHSWLTLDDPIRTISK